MCSDLKHYTDKLCTGKLSAEDEVNVVAVEETDDLLSKRIARPAGRAGFHLSWARPFPRSPRERDDARRGQPHLEARARRRDPDGGAGPTPDPTTPRRLGRGQPRGPRAVRAAGEGSRATGHRGPVAGHGRAVVPGAAEDGPTRARPDRGGRAGARGPAEAVPVGDVFRGGPVPPTPATRGPEAGRRRGAKAGRARRRADLYRRTAASPGPGGPGDCGRGHRRGLPRLPEGAARGPGRRRGARPALAPGSTVLSRLDVYGVPPRPVFAGPRREWLWVGPEGSFK